MSERERKKKNSSAGNGVAEGGCCLLEAFAIFSAIALVFLAAPSLFLS